MTEQPVQPVAPNSAEPVAPQGAGGGDNERWNGFLKDIPSAFHEPFKNQLREWDRGVNERFQQIHTEYAPWKDFKESGINPDTVTYGLQLMELLESNPQALYNALSELPGITPAQAAAITESGTEAEEGYEYTDPRIQGLEEVTQTMAQIMSAQYEEQQAAKMDQELEAELKAAEAKHGPYDMPFVLNFLYANPNATADEAVAKFRELQSSILTNSNRPAANTPIIMNQGGGVPSSAMDVSKLSEADRKNLAVQFLKNAKEQNR